MGNALAKMVDFSFNVDLSVQGSLSRTALTTSRRSVEWLVARQEESRWCSILSSAKLAISKEGT